MFNQKNAFSTFFFLFLLLTGSLISGCGGGGSSASGGSTGESLPTKTLSWQPPVSYTDGTALDPASDLDSFEIYFNENGSFSNSDSPGAVISAHVPETAQITASFNLANLGPYISKGIVYCVSVRAVGVNGLKSDFSPAATFSF